jgi:hypothetical protein
MALAPLKARQSPLELQSVDEIDVAVAGAQAHVGMLWRQRGGVLTRPDSTTLCGQQVRRVGGEAVQRDGLDSQNPRH